MKSWLIAALFLLGVSGAPAFADYIIIIANPVQPPAEQAPPGGPMNPGGPPPQLQAPPPPPPQQEIWLDPDAPMQFATVIFEIKKILPTQTNVNSWMSGRGVLKVSHQLFLKPDQWNEINLLKKTKLCDVYLVPTSTPRDVFFEMGKALDKGPKDQAKTTDELAKYALMHGGVNTFAEKMDKFALEQPGNATAKDYLKVKADLARPVKTAQAKTVGTRLLQGFNKSQTSDHYVVYHNFRDNNPPEVTERLTRLENNFRSFYYWFALQGVLLPIPTERLPVIVTSKEDDFKQLNAVLTRSPVVADGFIGTREGILVLSAKRLDEQYKNMEKYTTQWWAGGIERTKVLESVDSGFPATMTRDVGGKAEAQTGAAVLKAMENDGELAGLTHNATRQLLFATGLLHRHVASPEWVQFGMSSFFETPMGSPGLSFGMPSSEYLPAFRDLKKRKNSFGKPADTLRKIVTDHYFREADMTENYTATRHARAASWALTYFLVQKELNGLQTYFKELAKMPRDYDLDEDVLLWVFCKSFGLLDSTNKPDEKLLTHLADKWNAYIDETRLDQQAVVDYLRVIMAAKLKEIDAANEKLVGTAPGQTNPGNPQNPIHNPGQRPPGVYNPNPYPGGRPGGWRGVRP